MHTHHRRWEAFRLSGKRERIRRPWKRTRCFLSPMQGVRNCATYLPSGVPVPSLWTQSAQPFRPRWSMLAWHSRRRPPSRERWGRRSPCCVPGNRCALKSRRRMGRRAFARVQQIVRSASRQKAGQPSFACKRRSCLVYVRARECLPERSSWWSLCRYWWSNLCPYGRADQMSAAGADSWLRASLRNEWWRVFRLQLCQSHQLR